MENVSKMILNVVFAADDNYASLLSISIFSLIKNNKNDFNKINIFILDDGISKKNRIKLINTFNEKCVSISFIKTKRLDEMNFNILGLERKLNKQSYTTYARLFISTLLPNNIDKIIYMDCDSLIVGSFKKLWEIDISSYFCAGVLDGINTAVKKKLGFNKEDFYINAGFLYINLKKWRENNVEEKFLKFMIENQQRFYQHDQGVLNNVFKDEILIIDPKYNLQIYFQTLNYNLARKFMCMETEYYSHEIVDESRNNPIFLHFCGPKYDRPWYNRNHPYAKIFLEFAEICQCSNVINYLNDFPLKAKILYKSMNNKFIMILLNLIPSSLIRKIVNKNALRQIEEQDDKAHEIYLKNEKNDEIEHHN